MSERLTDDELDRLMEVGLLSLERADAKRQETRKKLAERVIRPIIRKLIEQRVLPDAPFTISHTPNMPPEIEQETGGPVPPQE